VKTVLYRRNSEFRSTSSWLTDVCALLCIGVLSQCQNSLFVQEVFVNQSRQPEKRGRANSSWWAFRRWLCLITFLQTLFRTIHIYTDGKQAVSTPVSYYPSEWWGWSEYMADSQRALCWREAHSAERSLWYRASSATRRCKRKRISCYGVAWVDRMNHPSYGLDSAGISNITIGLAIMCASA